MAVGLDPPPGDLGRYARELRTHSPDGDKYSGRSVMPQPPGVQHCMIRGNSHCGWGSTWGYRNCVAGESIGVDC